MCTSDNRLFFNTATSHTFCSELRSCNLSYNWDNFELYALFSFWQREWVIVFHWNLLLVLTCKHWDLSYSAINLRSWGCWPILRFSMWHAGTRGMEFAWFLTFCEGRTTSETSVITYSVRYIALDRLLLPYLEPWAHTCLIPLPAIWGSWALEELSKVTSLEPTINWNSNFATWSALSQRCIFNPVCGSNSILTTANCLPM